MPSKVTLTVAIDGQEVSRYIVSGPLIRIGRGPENEVQIENVSISRQHAQIEEDKDHGHALVDLGSTNGTYLNGQRVQRAAIKDGDEIELGSLKIKYGIQAMPHDLEAGSTAKVDVGAFREMEARFQEPAVINKGDRKFHRSDCRDIVGVPAGDVVSSSTGAAALSSGFSPCERCYPWSKEGPRL